MNECDEFGGELLAAVLFVCFSQHITAADMFSEGREIQSMMNVSPPSSFNVNVSPSPSPFGGCGSGADDSSAASVSPIDVFFPIAQFIISVIGLIGTQTPPDRHSLVVYEIAIEISYTVKMSLFKGRSSEITLFSVLKANNIKINEQLFPMKNSLAKSCS